MTTFPSTSASSQPVTAQYLFASQSMQSSIQLFAKCPAQPKRHSILYKKPCARLSLRNLNATKIQCGEQQKPDDAKKVLRKAQKNLRKSLQSISKELGEDEGGVEGAIDLVDPLWTDMYTAQKTLYEREMCRWDQERKMWDQREQALLQELRRLQQQVADLMNAGYGHAESGKPLAETRPSAPLSPVKAEEKSSGIYAEVGAQMPEFFNADKTEQEYTLSSVAASMHAAFAAVDQEDVLSPDFEKKQQELEEKFTSGEWLVSDGSEQKDPQPQTEEQPVETVKSPPAGPLPELTPGDDDIFWMNKLQAALLKKGYFCGEMDCEDFVFAEGTTDALLAFQASEGLAETGIADEDTWAALLGNTVDSENTASGGLEAEKDASESENDVSNKADAGPKKNGSTFSLISEEQSDAVSTSFPLNIDPKLPKTKNGWPALQENDGGKEVHQLHCCLSEHGYHCGEDDMHWWFFGSDTINAIKTFQACNGLPESGTCTEKTWLALLGESSVPNDLDKMETGDTYDEDRAAQGEHSGGVWLLGEQRWEKNV